jgi:outer membrane protein TolC
MLFGLVLAGAPAAWGQTPGPPKSVPGKSEVRVAKSALEEALAEALKNNPDLRVASAKLQEAEAELFRTRLRVVQRVVTQHRAVEQAREAVKVATDSLTFAEKDYKGGTVPVRLVQEARQKLVLAKTALADAEAEWTYLLGATPKRETAAGRLREHLTVDLLLQQVEQNRIRRELLLKRDLDTLIVKQRAALDRTPLADKLRKALAKRVTIKFEEKTPNAVLAQFRKEFPDIPIAAPAKGFAAKFAEPVVNLTDVPWGVALQMLEDGLGGYHFVVREYGLLLVARDRVPPGAVLLDEFRKSKNADTTDPKKQKPK